MLLSTCSLGTQAQALLSAWFMRSTIPCVRGILFSEKTDNKNVCEVPVSARERESRAGKWWSGGGEARESVVDAAVLSDELGGDVV